MIAAIIIINYELQWDTGMFGTTVNLQAVGKYLLPAKSLEFETNGIQRKAMKFKFIFSILRDILIKNVFCSFMCMLRGAVLSQGDRLLKL